MQKQRTLQLGIYSNLFSQCSVILLAGSNIFSPSPSSCSLAKDDKLQRVSEVKMCKAGGNDMVIKYASPSTSRSHYARRSSTIITSIVRKLSMVQTYNGMISLKLIYLNFCCSVFSRAGAVVQPPPPEYWTAVPITQSDRYWAPSQST